jgi:hypothetical protein
MTRHYTHVGELAAGQAVAALPSVVGDQKKGKEKDKAKVEIPPEAVLQKVRAIVEGMTGRDWKRVRREVLELIPTGPRGGEGKACDSAVDGG